MRTTYFFTVCLLVLGLMGSCTKCLQCTVKNRQGEQIFMEECGDKEQLEAFQKVVEDSVVANKQEPHCLYSR